MKALAMSSTTPLEKVSVSSGCAVPSVARAYFTVICRLGGALGWDRENKVYTASGERDILRRDVGSPKAMASRPPSAQAPA